MQRVLEESDSRGDLHQTVKVLRSEARNHQKIICLLKKQLQWNSVSDARSQLDLKMMASNMEQLQTNHEDLQRTPSTLEKENKPRERKKWRIDMREEGRVKAPNPARIRSSTRPDMQ